MAHIKCPKCNLKNNFKYKNNLYKHETIINFTHKLQELKLELSKHKGDNFSSVFQTIVTNLELDFLTDLQATYETCMCIDCGTDQCTPLDFCIFQLEFLKTICSNRYCRRYFQQKSNTNFVKVKQFSMELKQLIESIRNNIFINTTKSSNIYNNSMPSLFWDDFWQWKCQDLLELSEKNSSEITEKINSYLEKGYKVSHNHIFPIKEQTSKIESHKNLYDLELNYIYFFSIKKLEQYLLIDDFESKLSKLVKTPNEQILETLSMSNNSLILYKAFNETERLIDIVNIHLQETSRKTLNDSKFISSLLEMTSNMKATSLSSNKHSNLLYKTTIVAMFISFLGVVATVATIPAINDYLKGKINPDTRIIIINSKDINKPLIKPSFIEDK